MCFPVAYKEGRAPSREGETALSYLLSEELGLDPGDTFQVNNAGKYEMCTVTGVYSDITNGGKTAKLFSGDPGSTENVMWRIVYVTLKEGANQEAFVDKYTAAGAEVTDIASRIMGTYGPTLRQIQRVSALVKIMAFVIILLVIILFVRMIIANQRNQISVKKALGFKSIDIRISFWKSCLPYGIAGIVLGTFCGCILGERLCGMALQSLGAVGFKFVLHIQTGIRNMAVGGASAILAVYLGSNGIKRIKAVECCRGRE